MPLTRPARTTPARLLTTCLACVTAAALVAGCEPQTEQPVKVMALVRSAGDANQPGGKYVPKQVELRTLADVVTLRGSVAELIGNGRIVVNPQDPELALVKDDEGLRKVFVKSEGNAVHASYIEREGVLYPNDFHTWNMVTSYYQFERAFDYFQKMGVPAATLSSVRVYYFPSFTLTSTSRDEATDNALYFSPVKAFMVLPFDKQQQAPLAMNAGVIAHEYSHLVFNRVVYSGAALPVALTHWSEALVSTPPANLLKSLDEGFADFHAFVASCSDDFGCDPRWIESSFDSNLADRRDISGPNKCMTPGLQTSLDTLGINDFVASGLEYQVGTLFASSLYHAGASPQDWEVLSKALISSYSSANPTGLKQLIDASLEKPDDFHLYSVADTILSHVTSDSLRTKLCGELLGRFKLQREELIHCPAQAVPTGECP